MWQPEAERLNVLATGQALSAVARGIEAAAVLLVDEAAVVPPELCAVDELGRGLLIVPEVAADGRRVAQVALRRKVLGAVVRFISKLLNPASGGSARRARLGLLRSRVLARSRPFAPFNKFSEALRARFFTRTGLLGLDFGSPGPSQE